MQNKKIIGVGLLLGLFMVLKACGQMKTQVSVKDEQGNPIKEAEVEFLYARPKGYDSVKKTTNDKGLIKDTGKTNFHLNVYVEKNGYYQAAYAKSNKGTNLEKNQDHNLNVVLKKIINPIPLYAKKTYLKPPKERGPVGYDFEVGDWLEPYGKGKTADAFFESQLERKSSRDFDYRFNVTFPNVLDGLLAFESNWTSALRSLYNAPSEGYKRTLNLHSWRRPNSGGRKGNRMGDQKNYWLRVRSKVDDQGELISAHYVKIYGDFPDIKYYFNPTPNDRNLEFDPKQNLFGKLPSDEQVSAP